jgi:SAM-dependent methyltransferase
VSWPAREGIASFLSTDFYWGEITRPEMRALLEDIAKRGWQEVVYRELPRRYPDRYRYIFHPIRADWFYLGGVQQRQAALDLGAGWGGLSLRLSRLFHQVVAVEAVWERIKFASMLFQQEGASNVLPLHADIHHLPLPKESFDLVVMNGVLEWAALGGEAADPEAAQRKLLAKVWELLRPGGSLYIGIENRFALIFLIGGRDHGQSRGMGVLPRPLARWYGRLSGVPGRHPLTHSPAGYRRLLQQNGFDDIQFYCAFPSYSYPRVLIPLTHPTMLAWAAKRSSDWRMDSMSLPARVAHRLAAHPTVARLVCPRAESLAIWARRPPAQTRASCSAGSQPAPADAGSAEAVHPEGLAQQVLALIRARWSELGLRSADGGAKRSSPRELAMLQLSGNWEACGKISWFVFPEHSPEPAVVVKVARTPSHGDRLANEHHTLSALQAISADLARHIPRPLALWEAEGHLISVQEYLPGRAISRLAWARPPQAAIATVLGTCAPFLTQLGCETRLGLRRGKQHPFLRPLLERATFVTRSQGCSAEAQTLLRGLLQLARQAEAADLPVVAHHGDLNTFDILIPCPPKPRRRGNGPEFRVTDWEWSTSAGLPFLDLVTLGILAAEPVARRQSNAIQAATRALIGAHPLPGEPVYPEVREIASEYCRNLGVEDELRLPLAAAALLHRFIKDREASYAGTRYITLADAGPWVTAGDILLAAAPMPARGCEQQTPALADPDTVSQRAYGRA